MHVDDRDELPVGFGFALALREDALAHFSQLSEQERGAVIAKAREVQSKQEMQSLVNELAAQG